MTGVQELIDRSIPFLEVVKNRPAGAELELWLHGTSGTCSGSRPTTRPGRRGHHRRYEFFGAPVALIVTASRGPLLSAMVDAGLFVQALMPAARGTGLHTCPHASLIDFPVLRRHAAVPAEQVIVCGIALGYADDSHPVSGQRSSREPITSFARFYDS